jgi:hypothetical protein
MSREFPKQAHEDKNLMTAITPELQPLSRKKERLFSLVALILFLLVAIVAAEAVSRWKGLRPWTVRRTSVILETPGSYNSKHPTLGYLTNPGAFTFSQPGAYRFTMTHRSNGLRITHPPDTYSNDGKREIWIFGCSFTQGWTLDDNQTYAWSLQERLKDYEVVNFGVAGYGTVQSLIQCREALNRGGKPVVAVLAYGSFHDIRNTVTRGWIKRRLSTTGGNALGALKLPYATLSANRKVEILYKSSTYSWSPVLHRSAFFNFLDETYNRSLESSYKSHEVSAAVIEEFAHLCQANGIPLVVAGIYADPTTSEMLEHCQKLGIKTLDISVDLTIPGNANAYDGHPTAIVNQQYAGKLEAYLCGDLIECKPLGGVPQ